MGSLTEKLAQKGAIQPPSIIRNAVHYEVMMGSVAYGVSNDLSDRDIYGFAIPPKDVIFPHLRGEIPGFGRQIPAFEQFTQHHIPDPDGKKEDTEEGRVPRTYDITIYNIVKFFSLCMESNPNMVDALFVPRRCILHTTAIGEMVRENRKIFLHKGAFHKFKGYAYSQMHKIEIKNPAPGSKRAQLVEQFNYDVKFAYHVVRLIDEIEQILTLGDLDLERAKEEMKSVRRGEWKLEDIKAYFERREKELEEAYAKSSLPHAPDEEKIKQLLLNCLEAHFGSLSDAITHAPAAVRAIHDIQAILDKLSLESGETGLFSH